jgi:hypothetical protein
MRLQFWAHTPQVCKFLSSQGDSIVVWNELEREERRGGEREVSGFRGKLPP